jgi:N-acetylmuramoyl-L-alanine amidase
VLDAGLKLREALQARGRYQVELTRDGDRFIALPDRVAFARAKGADLFISLHADSHANPEACGASVYTLSERGANRAAAMMDQQNWSLDQGAAHPSMVRDILRDLTQRETTNKSAEFAETAIHGLRNAGPVLDNSHRSAGFFVLLAPDVPAVLIETGFLSNVEDERRLADPRSRERIAEALAGSIDSFFGAPVSYASA